MKYLYPFVLSILISSLILFVLLPKPRGEEVEEVAIQVVKPIVFVRYTSIPTHFKQSIKQEQQQEGEQVQEEITEQQEEYQEDTYTQIEYFDNDENGQIGIIRPWVNGKVHGVVQTYNREGQLIAETPWYEGQVHGVEKEYNSDGDLIRETPYEQGEKHGIKKEYFSATDGGLLEEINYIHNVVVETTKRYHSNGQLEMEIPHNTLGQRHGIERVYNSNGQLESEINWVDGQAVETILFIYNEEERLIGKRVSNLLEELSYDEQGRLISRNVVY